MYQIDWSLVYDVLLLKCDSKLFVWFEFFEIHLYIINIIAVTIQFRCYCLELEFSGGMYYEIFKC